MHSLVGHLYKPSSAWASLLHLAIHPGSAGGQNRSPPGSGEASQVHIASERQVQSVIDFLSNSVYSSDTLSREGDSGERGGDRSSGGYPTSGGDGGGGGYPTSYRGDRGAPPTSSDNSSSGSSGIGIEGGASFRENSGREAMRSRSTSMSPDVPDGERNVEGKRNGLGSTDSGINVPPQHRSHDRSYDLGRIPTDEAELQERSKKRKSKEVLDFSGGFGPITNPVGVGERCAFNRKLH